MYDISASALPQPVHPPAVSLREAWPWALLGLALLALVYLVAFEQGTTALTGGSLVHEWMHDGRHLLGFPCH